MRLLYFMALCFFISCSINNEYEKGRCYRDYDIFKREGINSIDSADLGGLFFTEIDDTDSTILLVIYDDKREINRIRIPKGDNVIYDYHDINDGPRHYFSKVTDKEIIRYSYEEDPYNFLLEDIEYVLLYQIIPDYIEIVNQDTITTFILDCYTESFNENINTEISIRDIEQYAIKPFSLNIDSLMKSDCERKIQYFRGDTLYAEPLGYDPYWWKRKFEIWKPFHDINRML